MHINVETEKREKLFGLEEKMIVVLLSICPFIGQITKNNLYQILQYIFNIINIF